MIRPPSLYQIARRVQGGARTSGPCRVSSGTMALVVSGICWITPAATQPLPPVPPARLSADAPLPPARPPEADLSTRPKLHAEAVPLPQAPTGPHLPAPPVVGPVPPPADAVHGVEVKPVATMPSPDEIAAAERVCAVLFAGRKVVARTIEPVGGSGGCGMAAPIEVQSILTPDGKKIALQPPVQVTCPLAGALADWVRDDLWPAFTKANRTLTALTGTSGYACRSRDHIAGAKISEHAKGDAVDIGGFSFASGKPLGVQDKDAPDLMTEVKNTACARFTTLLGPGSDGFHATHMHADLLARRNNYRICQWVLP